MVASEGLWTGEPAVNFITQAVSSDAVDPVKLAGRVSRAMLGQRIDCAECHDHPFAPVTQAQFEGLAACFAGKGFAAGGSGRSESGVHDRSAGIDAADGIRGRTGVPHGGRDGAASASRTSIRTGMDAG